MCLIFYGETENTGTLGKHSAVALRFTSTSWTQEEKSDAN